MILETQEDRDNESRVIEIFGDKIKAEVLKLMPPTKYVIDFLLHRDKVPVALAEVKCRDVSKDKYKDEGLLISCHKIIHGLQLSAHLNVPFFMVVEWTDGIWCRRVIHGEGFKVKIAGRTDRPNVKGDTEPCFLIPIDDQWKPL
jgi:hypothetical protein